MEQFNTENCFLEAILLRLPESELTDRYKTHFRVVLMV